MQTNLLILLAAGGLLTVAPANAAEPMAAAPAQAQPAESSKLICRKEVETGSILKKRRICRTKRQWELAAERSREATQGQMSGGSSSN